MNPRSLFLLAVSTVVPVMAAAPSQISSVASREALLATAKALACVENVDPMTVALAVDPFNPPAANLRWEEPPEAGATAEGIPDSEMVHRLVDGIHPTGSIMLGGEPYLLFTERRQKIGDKLVVALDKIEYTVEIVSIANNRFRIRYNGQEAERPIK